MPQWASLNANLRRFVGSAVFLNTFSAATFFLSLVSFSATQHGSELQSVQYSLKAMELAPSLIPNRRPKIVSVFPRVNKVNNVDSNKKKGDDVYIGLGAFKTAVEFTNAGKTPAYIVGILTADYSDGDAKIRKDILNDTSQYLLEAHLFPDFWKAEQIIPGASVTLNFEMDAENIRNEQFTRHYLVLYKNAAGMLYDTYYWSTFGMQRVPCTKAKSSHDFFLDLLVRHANSKIFQQVCFAIDVVDSNVATYVYSEDEANRVKNLMLGPRQGAKHGFDLWISSNEPCEIGMDYDND